MIPSNERNIGPVQRAALQDYAEQALAKLWIPITEKWPPERVSVLTAGPGGIVVAYWQVINICPGKDVRWWLPANVHAEYDYDTFLNAHESNNPEVAVTHWMPLMGLPK